MYLVDVNNMYYPVQTHLPHYHQQQQQTSIIDVSHYGFQNLVGLSLHDSLSGAYLGQINFKNNQIGSNSAVTRFVDQNFVLNHVQNNNQLHGLQNHLHSHLYHECNSGEIWSKDVEKCVLDKGDLSGNNKDITTGTESPTILQPVVPTTTEVSMTPTPTNSANLVKISALSLLLSAVILFI